ncbi:MAG: hypothetical protein K9N34_02605 [Candidatus Marinimicrobia bacterium]|nr:hypothetical protein [Candidatus Neomarinimicrobiota bacterium]MCF7841169.1 hypothetical protein [Candidatus Neomarinimicrobiota bacterium]MCF7902058.1 hypothetical protein [Candidatus Neomarinimicrobiota bacterium]
MTRKPLYRKRKSSQAGITIGEIIIFILIASISYLALIKVFDFAHAKSMEGEVRTTMTNLALDGMEIIRSKRFDENTIPPWSSSLGPDVGEAGYAQYDDVDDFQGLVENGVNGYSGYSRHTRVFYIDRSNNIEDSVGIVTDMKRIIVKVSLPGYSPVDITSIVSSRYNVLSY